MENRNLNYKKGIILFRNTNKAQKILLEIMTSESKIAQLREERGDKEISNPDKTIKIKIDFWTDGMIKPKNKRVPKVCWDYGTIHIVKNKGHSIKASEPIQFDHLRELESKIRRALAEAGIEIIDSST